MIFFMFDFFKTKENIHGGFILFMKKIYKINFCKTKCEYFGQISFLATKFQIIFCPHAARALPIKKSSGMGTNGHCPLGKVVAWTEAVPGF